MSIIPNSCSNCVYKQKDQRYKFIWTCGLESKRGRDKSIMDVDGEPYMFRPFWCKLNGKELRANEPDRDNNLAADNTDSPSDGQ